MPSVAIRDTSEPCQYLESSNLVPESRLVAVSIYKVRNSSLGNASCLRVKGETRSSLVQNVAVYINGLLSGCSQIVLGAVQLNLSAVHLQLLQNVGLLGVVGSCENAVNSLAILVKNGNGLVKQIRVILLNVGELEDCLAGILGLGGVIPVNNRRGGVQSYGVGVLARWS